MTTDHDLNSAPLMVRYSKARRMVLPDCPTVADREALLHAVLWPNGQRGRTQETDPHPYAPPDSGEKHPTNAVGNGNGSTVDPVQLVLDFGEDQR